MPSLTIWSLRCALVALVVGFSVGAFLLMDKATAGIGLGAGWLHLHLHLLMFGFFVQAIFAVAYWMLPRFEGKRPRKGFAIAAVVLLNTACLIALFFPLARLHQPVVLVESVAAIAFAIHAWPRIKAFGV